MQPDFIQIPTQLLGDKTLQPSDRILYGYIYWLTKLKMERCVAGNKYLSELTGFNTRSIQNMLTRLEKAGYIRRIFADEQHKNRLEIICSIAYSNVSSNDDIGVIRNAHEVSSNDDHNKKRGLRRFNKNSSINSEKKEPWTGTHQQRIAWAAGSEADRQLEKRQEYRRHEYKPKARSDVTLVGRIISEKAQSYSHNGSFVLE